MLQSTIVKLVLTYAPLPSSVASQADISCAEGNTSNEVLRFVRTPACGTAEPEEEYRCIVSILECVCGIDILDEEWAGEVDTRSGAPSVLVRRPVSPIPLWIRH